MICKDGSQVNMVKCVNCIIMIHAAYRSANIKMSLQFFVTSKDCKTWHGYHKNQVHPNCDDLWVSSVKVGSCYLTHMNNSLKAILSEAAVVCGKSLTEEAL